MEYDPPREKKPKPPTRPLEIDLVFNVRPCGTCSFFWPPDPSRQPYGPYPTYDFGTNEPGAPDPPGSVEAFKWITGKTQGEAFPDPEVMDGCRKAPIMTIGINPNLTAFAPGRVGASWCYPHFTDDGGTDPWTKYAYYYRYRSVYQEFFDLKFVEKYLLPEPRVVAARAGYVTSALRPTDAPGYQIKVRYDGDKTDTTIDLARDLGTPRWVLLFDAHGPNSRFAPGDVIAARLSVPAGQTTQVMRGQVGYYEQFVPVLERLEATIRAAGHPRASLRMGEDVCQLDMVACASPHWNPGFLGGTGESERAIIRNCVAKNAWAMKQLVQTKPAVLFLVGEATWDMFRDSFGALVHRQPGLPPAPGDGAFTLLRATSDPTTPTYFSFEGNVRGKPYSVKTRLVIAPHFSYSTNFTPQWRLSPAAWKDVQANEPAVAALLQHDRRVVYQPPATPDGYAAFLVQHGASEVLARIEAVSAAAARTLAAGFYDAHAMMAAVLDDMYKAGALRYGRVGDAEALTRSDGPCKFCVNDDWTFPLGCPYGKPDEASPEPGWLEGVAAAVVSAGRAGLTRKRGVS